MEMRHTKAVMISIAATYRVVCGVCRCSHAMARWEQKCPLCGERRNRHMECASAKSSRFNVDNLDIPDGSCLMDAVAPTLTGKDHATLRTVSGWLKNNPRTAYLTERIASITRNSEG